MTKKTKLPPALLALIGIIFFTAFVFLLTLIFIPNTIAKIGAIIFIPFLVLTGFGLIQKRNIARISAIGIAIVAILLNLISFSQGPFGAKTFRLIISIIIIWYLFQHKTKRLFK